jgi:hypothetical protein
MITKEYLHKIKKSSKYYIKIGDMFYNSILKYEKIKDYKESLFYLYYYTNSANGRELNRMNNDFIDDICTLEFMKENYPEFLI